jgi:alanine-glyoxylate transaminase/serine-glyoxylate transaminase/serine-pyruvate transaminase
MAHTDTASSARNDVAAVRRALDAADHPALLMVDCIASMGCEPFEMDAWGVDVALAASQKGLMTPPGLGFVWPGPRALAAHATADLRTRYWDWSFRMQDGPQYLRFCGTAPVSLLFGIHEALRMIAEEGLENRWRRHRTLASAVRAAVDAWAAPDGLSLYVTKPEHRGDSVTTIDAGSIDPVQLGERCREMCGVTLGVGLADLAGRAFRIGHMGHVSAASMLGVLGVVESVLQAMGAPTGGSGVAAAATVVGQALAT